MSPAPQSYSFWTMLPQMCRWVLIFIGILYVTQFVFAQHLLYKFLANCNSLNQILGKLDENYNLLYQEVATIDMVVFWRKHGTKDKIQEEWWSSKTLVVIDWQKYIFHPYYRCFAKQAEFGEGCLLTFMNPWRIFTFGYFIQAGFPILDFEEIQVEGEPSAETSLLTVVIRKEKDAWICVIVDGLEWHCNLRWITHQ